MTNTIFIGAEASVAVHDQLTPYMGYKVIGILNPVGEEPLKIFGPHYNTKEYMYENMAPSYCQHTCQDFEKCSCGFYAYESSKETFSHWVHQANSIRSFLIAKVAFSGTTVICENGARGSIQRIVKLYVPCCWNCDNTAELFVKHSGGSLSPACADCLDKFKVDDSITLSFSELSDKLTVDGFNPVKILPAPMGKFMDVMESDDKLSEIMVMIQYLAQNREMEMLDSITTAIESYK